MTVLLVRHTEVARAWRGRCYGASDAGLSRAGGAQARALAAVLADWRPDLIVQSGLRRTAALTVAVAHIARVPVAVDSRWRERDFGDWEGRSWSAIYRATGNAMDGMIDAPDTFRPGGGETTTELAARAVQAFDALPPGRSLVIAHGGSIAALLGTRANLLPAAWLALVPEPGGRVELVP